MNINAAFQDKNAPCPKCGSLDVVIEQQGLPVDAPPAEKIIHYHVRCVECNTGREHRFTDAKEAVEHWRNQKYLPDCVIGGSECK